MLNSHLVFLTSELTGARADVPRKRATALSRVRLNDLLNEAAARQDKTLIYS